MHRAQLTGRDSSHESSGGPAHHGRSACGSPASRRKPLREVHARAAVLSPSWSIHDLRARRGAKCGRRERRASIRDIMGATIRRRRRRGRSARSRQVDRREIGARIAMRPKRRNRKCAILSGNEIDRVRTFRRAPWRSLVIRVAQEPGHTSPPRTGELTHLRRMPGHGFPVDWLGYQEGRR